MIKAVIFDFDGVISDSFEFAYRTNKKIYEIFGKDEFMSMDDFRETNSTDWKALFRSDGFTEDELQKVPEVFLQEAMKIINEVKFFEGIAPAIRKAHEKFKLAIVSNGDSKRIAHQLSENDLDNLFECIIGLEAEKHKPDPYQLNLCMKRLDVLPQECVFVGDTNVDIIAGRNAKVAKVIAVSYGYHSAEKLSNADIIVHSPQELLKTLEVLL